MKKGIIILLGLGGVGAYLYYKNKKKNAKGVNTVDAIPPVKAVNQVGVGGGVLPSVVNPISNPVINTRPAKMPNIEKVPYGMPERERPEISTRPAKLPIMSTRPAFKVIDPFIQPLVPKGDERLKDIGKRETDESKLDKVIKANSFEVKKPIKKPIVVEQVKMGRPMEERPEQRIPYGMPLKIK